MYISIDPASHARSAMGLVAIVYSRGTIIVIGCASVVVERCAALQTQMIASAFTKRALEHVFVRRTSATWSLQPIIECNGSEVMAVSLLQAVKSVASQKHVPVANPWKKSVFKTGITVDVGIWTTERNKLAGIQTIYTALFEGRIAVAQNPVTVGAVYSASYREPDVSTQLDLLKQQLKSIRDQPDGKVSGKSADAEDDVAMAFIIAVWWSYCIRAAKASGGI